MLGQKKKKVQNILLMVPQRSVRKSIEKILKTVI